MSNFKNRVGQKFGRLTIIKYAGKSKWGTTYWECKCDCGNSAVVSNNNLVEGSTKSCGCLRKERREKCAYKPKIRDLLNQKIGMLLVIEKLNSNKDGRVLWRCKCDCGNETVVVGNDIGRRTNSCGCLKEKVHLGKTEFSVDYSLKEIKKELRLGEAGFNKLYKRYRNGAEKRSLSFDLSEEEFRGLTKNKCHYCGKIPSTKIKEKSEHGLYVYNGIDRIDNTKGYTIDNCVSCCVDCNRSKYKLSIEAWKTHIINIYKHWIKITP